MAGMGPVNCPTAMHDVTVGHEIPLRPPVGSVEYQFCPPEPGLETTDHLPLASDSTRVALIVANGVDCHPAAVHAVGFVHDTP